MNIEELEALAIKLAEKYKKIAIECVEVKNIFPPNRYTFTTNFFRKIEGWDTEWYDVMYNWMRVLEKDGWTTQYVDKEHGEIYFSNFQYMFNKELPHLDMAFKDGDFDKIINVKEVSSTKCNQAFLFDREIKIPKNC